MKKHFIGFYDYTVILTLLSAASAVVGMTLAMQDHFRLALVCLALCGLFDAFDGRVARTKKNRTDEEKLYGIQLDSLVDVISFGFFPATLCFLMGMRTLIDIIILCAYVICGVIRLAYFNVLETNRQANPSSGEKVFHGLPITSISIVLPLSFLATFVFTRMNFIVTLRIIMVLVALLFVLNFKMKPPKTWHLIIFIVIVALAAAAMLFFSRYKLPKNVLPPEEPLIEEILDE